MPHYKPPKDLLPSETGTLIDEKTHLLIHMKINEPEIILDIVKTTKSLLSKMFPKIKSTKASREIIVFGPNGYYYLKDGKETDQNNSPTPYQAQSARNVLKDVKKILNNKDLSV